MMDAKERAFVVEQLCTSEARVITLLDGLTAEQWAFREALERWSIAENVEHLVLFERFIRAMLLKILAEAAEPEKAAAATAKTPLVMKIGAGRHVTIQARDVVLPMGRWSDTDAMTSMLRRERAKTIAFVQETDADLRSHFFAHLLVGDLDAYQWLLLMAQHSERHARQMEQVMRDARFPHS